MSAPPGIVLVEGADASGKTTLVDRIVKRHGARRMHGRVWRDMARWHRGMMRRALRLAAAGELVVLDRHWVSELVYGPVYRGRTAYSDALAAEFDQAIHGAPGVTVLCVPSNLPKHLARFELLKSVRPEAFDRVEEVAIRYHDLLFGNIAHPGMNLVDQYIRYQDFCAKRCVYWYNIDASRMDPETASEHIVELLR